MVSSIVKTLAVVALCLLGSATAQNRDSTVPAQNATFQGRAIYRQGFASDDYRFDFPLSNADSRGENSGGSTNVLTVNTNPSTFDTSIGQNLVSMNPRTIVQPHYHPRSTEVAHVIEGNLKFELVEENGGRPAPVIIEVGPGQSIYIPQGYLHTIRNDSPRPAKFIASFSTPDFGTVFINQRLFLYGADIIADAWGISMADAQKLIDVAQKQAGVRQLGFSGPMAPPSVMA